MKNINSRALSLATSWTIIFIVAMTIVSELYKPLKTILADLSGHHWVSKGIVALIFFVILYKLLYKKTLYEKDSQNYELAVIGVTVLGGLAIFGFYIWHYFTA